MFRRTQYIALGTVLVLALALLNLPPSVGSRIKLACGAVFLPLFGLAHAAPTFMERTTYALLPRSALIAQVEELRRENERLKAESSQAAEWLAENTRLRQQNGAAPRGRARYHLALVVGREPTAWWRAVTIDYGTRDGAAVNQTVCTSEGLVGRIAEVGYSHSKVALIGDTDCGVSALVAETRDNGLIKGPQSTLDAGLVEWTATQHSPQVMAGQNLITSGLGGVFPKGIAIGRILDTHTERSGVTTTARVKLAANLDRLEEVFVLQPETNNTNATGSTP